MHLVGFIIRVCLLWGTCRAYEVISSLGNYKTKWSKASLVTRDNQFIRKNRMNNINFECSKLHGSKVSRNTSQNEINTLKQELIEMVWKSQFLLQRKLSKFTTGQQVFLCTDMSGICYKNQGNQEAVTSETIHEYFKVKVGRPVYVTRASKWLNIVWREKTNKMQQLDVYY